MRLIFGEQTSRILEPSPQGLISSRTLKYNTTYFNTEAEGGRIVKKWDFGAEKYQKKISKKKIKNQKSNIKHPTLFFGLWPLLAFFQCDPWCLLLQNLCHTTYSFIGIALL